MAGGSDEHNALVFRFCVLPRLTGAIAVAEAYDGLLDVAGRSLLR